jgi:hypothetical protein
MNFLYLALTVRIPLAIILTTVEVEEAVAPGGKVIVVVQVVVDLSIGGNKMVSVALALLVKEILAQVVL